jgi:transposase
MKRIDSVMSLNNNIYNVKLTDKEVYRILYLSKVKGLLPYQLEERFPVSKATIKSIINGKSRKDCYEDFMEYRENHPRKITELFEDK